jgi:hypothetical protein
MDDERVSLRSSEPIFPVADVVATVRYKAVRWGDNVPLDTIGSVLAGARFGVVAVEDAKCERRIEMETGTRFVWL